MFYMAQEFEMWSSSSKFEVWSHEVKLITHTTNMIYTEYVYYYLY